MNEQQLKKIIDDVNTKGIQKKSQYFQECQTFVQFQQQNVLSNLPDGNLEQIQCLINQCDRVKKYSANQELKEMLEFMKDHIIKNDLKEVTIDINGCIYQRLSIKIFNTLHNLAFKNLLYNDKGKLKYYTNENDERQVLSKDQAQLIMSCLKTKSKHYKLLEEYVNKTFQSPGQNINKSDLKIILENNINETNINQFKNINESFEIPETYVEMSYDQLYQRVLQILTFAGIIDYQIVYDLQQIIPKVIFKSLQIKKNFKNCKKCYLVLYGLIIPIYYLGNDNVKVQILADKNIHLQVFKNIKAKQGFVLHHINANEFDNRQDNLIYVPTDKHQKIHDFMNTEFKAKFQTNCFELEDFKEYSFYQKYLDNIQDEQMFQELTQASLNRNPSFDQEQFLEYIQDNI